MMTYYPDLHTATMVDAGPHIRAIGWLDAQHTFPTGNSSAEFLQHLRRYAENSEACIDALDWGFFMGVHNCELCRRCHTAGNIGVPSGDVLYVAPEMILHYVETHEYLPPQAFIEAVLQSAVPGTQPYSEAVSRFGPALSVQRTRDASSVREGSSCGNRKWSHRCGS